MQLPSNLWWNEDDPKPDWVLDAPFPNVAVAFALEKASISIVGKNFRLHIEGLNTDAPHIGYLQLRRASPVHRWRLSNQLSRINFARPNGDRVRICWQQTDTVILCISNRDDLFLNFEVATINLTADSIELCTRSAHNSFEDAYKTAFDRPWETEEGGQL